jgi:metal-dependent amidase/aminoacylase/carboxypeptidase family protein
VNDRALARGVGGPALERVFGAGAVRVEPQMVAEDFPYFGSKAPYFYFLLGTRNDAKGIASVNHTSSFDVDEDALPLGVRAMATLAWDFLCRGSGGRHGSPPER